MIEKVGLRTNISRGETQTIIGVIGDKTKLADYPIASLASVDNIVHVSKPYKLASRDFHPTNTVIDVRGSKIGRRNLWIIAGPCSIESEKQLLTIAAKSKSPARTYCAAEPYKPRTSPYAFQGMGEEGLKLLRKASDEFGIPTVTEVMDTNTVELIASYVDVLQIGARNAQNFALLKAVGKTDRPVLLKRGMSQTIEEWLMSAEYIMSEGNGNVVLCERGIRTYETAYRNTLDLIAIPVLKERTHLPIVVDPSHASGVWQYVTPMALSSIVAGADGIMVEVHHEPEKAMSDGAQSLKPNKFSILMNEIKKIAPVVGVGQNLN
jgi:3-deoxy-7-phosphoheptulonate synthase